MAHDVPVGDSTVRALRDGIVEFLVTQAGQGSTPAASAALSLLAQIEQAADADSHRARLADPDPLAVARYLGEIGATAEQLAAQIGRRPTDAETAAFQAGAAARCDEVRAIALARVRRGTGKAEPWMSRG